MFNLIKTAFSLTPGWIKAVENNGRAAVAVVLSDSKEVEFLLKGSVNYSGKDGWIEVPVRVEPADDSPFEAKMKCKLFAQAFHGRLAAGMKVNVRYDPQDKKRVLLVDDFKTLISHRVKK